MGEITEQRKRLTDLQSKGQVCSSSTAAGYKVRIESNTGDVVVEMGSSRAGIGQLFSTNIEQTKERIKELERQL